MRESEIQTCEVSRSAGYDPTGEFAVECGAHGEYCEVCEMVVCDFCHQRVAHHLDVKKNPASVTSPGEQRKSA
jgi:hypothetical protein